MRVSIASLFAGLAGTSQDVGLEVSGVTLDSRKATKGDLFLACRGTRSTVSIISPMFWRQVFERWLGNRVICIPTFPVCPLSAQVKI